MSKWSLRNVAVAAAVVSSLFASTAVWAHAKPVSQEPADKAVVAAPHEVKISYTETLEPSLSSLNVVDAEGKQVNTAKSAVDGKNAKLMSVGLPALKAGVYQVKWVAVATDGHRTQGQYSFTVK